MSDEEFLASYNSDTATKEEELRLINILLNMPDEDDCRHDFFRKSFQHSPVLAFSECSANTPNTTTINRFKTATFTKRKCSTAPLKK